MVSLANWRQSPYNRFSFHNVREFIPTPIFQANTGHGIPPKIDAAWLAGELNEHDLSQTLEASSTDALLVVRQNELSFEWRADHYQSAQPHILFSVSKSVTGLLVGVLESQGLIDPAAEVGDYLPEAKDFGYGHCTVQQVLDIQAKVAFIEDYHDQTGSCRYRSPQGGIRLRPPSQNPRGWPNFCYHSRAQATLTDRF